jgi:hypothetical protein
MASEIKVGFNRIIPDELKQGVERLFVLNALRKIGVELKADFKLTTATWDRKPTFNTKIGMPNTGAYVEVGTDNEIYGMINDGTAPGVILPTSPNVIALQMPRTYTSKSLPGVLQARPGGASGGVKYARAVWHPGITPRRFDVTIANIWVTKGPQLIQDAFDEALESTRYSI